MSTKRAMRQADYPLQRFATRWRSAAVRDLAWVIGSPPLVGSQGEQADWPDAAWCEAQLERMAPLLDQLERARWPGRKEFADLSDRRLGAYFEFLVARWLSLDERYDVLAHNLAIRQPLAAGGRETVGELDFVVRDNFAKRVEHWEVAVKFYLGGVPGSRGAWLGPGLKDRLDRKLDRVLTHQLPLPATAAARAPLSDAGLSIDRSRALIKGRLFYPQGVAMRPPGEAGNAHLRGWWLTRAEFGPTFDRRGWRWQVLTGEDRLAEQDGTNSADFRTLMTSMMPAEGNAQRPQLLAAFADGREVSRGYVVPDHWRDEAR